MGNLRRLHLWILLFTFCAAAISFPGCGAKLAQEPGRKPPVVNPQPARLTGLVFSSDGQRLDFGDVQESIVLTFASFTCLTCKEEAKQFVDHFTAMGGLPWNVRFYTVIVGEDAPAAAEWKTALGVTWTVAVDNAGTPDFSDDDALFRLNCPNRETPCTVTYNSQNRQIRRFHRKISVNEAQGETGPWLY